MSFYLFVSPFVSSISVLSFSECKSFTSLVTFTYKCFILSDAIVNEFLTFLSDDLLLMFRNTAGFGMLIFFFYPATFFSEFIY